MRGWTSERVARVAGARLLRPAQAGEGPRRVTIDSRQLEPGDLFVGLAGERVDGGEFAQQALTAGAWGVLAGSERVEKLAGAPRHGDANGRAEPGSMGALLAAPDPLSSLQRLATAWRRELGAAVIGVTGSTGKTSTKELILAVVAQQRRAVGSRANLNTEIGMPVEILAAPEGTEVLVLEMAMRGSGQIAELARIAEPDVGVIVNVGPAHLEQLGSLEAIAAAKAELLDALAPGATAVTPAGDPLLAHHIRPELRSITFGDGGDVRLISSEEDRVEIDAAGRRETLEVDFSEAHMRRNLLAAVAAAVAVGVTPSGRVQLAARPGRGAKLELAGEVTLIDDCYNANPMSMRAALDELATTVAHRPGARAVAVLGDMLELGPAAPDLHAELGTYAAAAGVQLLVTVGEQALAIGRRFSGEHQHARDAAEAAALLPDLVRPRDVVLVKGSRGVRLEQVCRALREREPA
jgi:UDP-N-acetylmuramoyl-tripeptide--D-alanyl-D-alanine ligase